MKKMYALVFALFVAGTSMAQSTWTIDKSHSKVGFSVAHMVVSETEGKFNDFEGTVASKTEDFNGAEVSFTAKTASVDTDNESRDGHLKSADFFDAAKYTDVAFKGNLAKSGNKYTLKGDFTMKGVTKKVEFDVTYGGTIDTGKGYKAGFKLVGKINRQDYGLTYGGKLSTGELTIGDVVEVIAKIELDKKA
jgi:polyisoprenoid-binding protein YceI